MAARSVASEVSGAAPTLFAVGPPREGPSPNQQLQSEAKAANSRRDLLAGTLEAVSQVPRPFSAAN